MRGEGRREGMAMERERETAVGTCKLKPGLFEAAHCREVREEVDIEIQIQIQIELIWAYG